MSSKPFHAIRLDHTTTTPVTDLLPVEAILQLTINGTPYTTTVRTPGADEFLARGLLFTEGVLVDPVITPIYRAIPDPDTGLTGCLDVTVPEACLAKEIAGRRSAMGSASCGLCGTREPEELLMRGGPIVPPPDFRLDGATIARLMTELTRRQPLFDATGGVHGVLAFGADGEVLCCHEDVGRHNAVDKCIGELIAQGTLNNARGMVVSGRLSYEIVFKAWKAGWPYLLAVSAPTSLAVEMAEAFGLCLIAFCRDHRATIYAHPELVTGGRTRATKSQK